MATSLEIHQLGANVGLAFDTEIERLSNTEVKEVIEFTYSFICEVQLDTVFTPENLPRLTTLLYGSNGVNITTIFNLIYRCVAIHARIKTIYLRIVFSNHSSSH